MNVLKINLRDKNYELEYGDKIVISTNNSSRILRECKKIIDYINTQIAKGKING